MATSITTTQSSAASASRNWGLSASEWAGFAASMIIARYRSGWSARHSSAMTLQGTRPPMIFDPVTGETLPVSP